MTLNDVLSTIYDPPTTVDGPLFTVGTLIEPPESYAYFTSSVVPDSSSFYLKQPFYFTGFRTYGDNTMPENYVSKFSIELISSESNYKKVSDVCVC